MKNRRATRADNVSTRLMQTVGMGSRIGDEFINSLENQLIHMGTRSRLTQDWLAYNNPGGSVSGMSAVGSDEATGLTAGEKMLCRQLYYLIAVFLAAWSYLTEGKIPLPKSFDLDSLLRGRLFEDMGLTNLKLEGCPSVNEFDISIHLAGLLDTINKLDLASYAGGDLFRPLYENLLTAKMRHATGEHYTPEWLAAHMLDQIGFRGEKETTLIDPACGSGAFLVEAILRKRARQGGLGDWGQVVGIDVNPLAVLAAKVNYLIAAGYRPSACAGDLEVPVFQHDVVTGDDHGLWSEVDTPWDSMRFDYVVGNPPWINWESLSADYRLATLDSWKKYGLFRHRGMDTILGKGKKDFSTLMTLASADRFLKMQGKMAFLITQSVFKSGGAADGFRRFCLPGGMGLKVLMVEDLSRLRPFVKASNRTAILYLEKGSPTVYPVRYRLWSHLSEDGGEKTILDMMAEPANPTDPGSPWITYMEGGEAGIKKILGTSDYRAREGANTGGANGILWVEVLDRPQPGLVRIRNLAASSRRRVQTVEAVIEDRLVYPLLKGNDVDRWRANPSAHIILTQDPTRRRGISPVVMARNYPRTLAYLNQFKSELEKRAAYRRYFKKTDPFYTMFDVGEYTLAPIKVVWRRFGGRMRAAVVEGKDKPVIPQETHTMVACRSSDEAWYLAGILNSLPVEYVISSYSMVGGKSFAGPGLLNFIKIPYYVGNSIQSMIAQTARRVSAGGDPNLLTEVVADLYGIVDNELRRMKSCWEKLGLS
ncbi:MAG: N-6 DNA methylase [Syntrophomonadaceae bacterium]|nr:N-6 DNA methylase [Syntrophomonadaceae bacterium]